MTYDSVKGHLYNEIFIDIFFINNHEKKNLVPCNYNYETVVYAFVVFINNKYLTKTGIRCEEVLSLHLHFQINLFWADLCSAKKGKNPLQFIQLFRIQVE